MPDVSPFTCGSVLSPKHGLFERWFPAPDMLALDGAGLDISDSSIKWLELQERKSGWGVSKYGALPLEKGVVEGGTIIDPLKLGASIKQLQEQVGGSAFIHAALPEEVAYVFSMHVPDVRDREQVRNIVEFELEGRVPLTSDKAVFDYSIASLHSDGIGAEIGVTVFPKNIVEGYVDACNASGLTLLSLEIEARSIARATLPEETEGAVLIADFGRARTGIAVIKKHIPIFTSTVSVGGSAMTQEIMEKRNVDESEAERIKNEEGIARNSDQGAQEAMRETANELAEEIARHFHYWDTRKGDHGERAISIAKVLLVGGSSNLKGLDEFIAGKVHARVERANVWERACSFNDYIPPIQKQYSLGYATAVGLALRSAH